MNGVDELLGALAAVDGRAVVIPLAEPSGHRAANDRMLAVPQAAEGRLVAFCRVVLALAAISNLAWIGRKAAGQPNLFFDTAWRNTGGQLERLLAGAEPLDLGPAATAPAPGPGPALKRVHTLLVTAAARLTTGYPGAEHVELARLACELPAGHANAAVARSIRDVIDRRAISGERSSARGPRAPANVDLTARHVTWLGFHLIFVAAAIARTPNLPIPVFGE